MLPSLLTVFLSMPFNKLPCSDGSSFTSDSTGWWPKRLSTLASLTSIGLTKVFWQYSLLCLPFTSTEINAGSCLAIAWPVWTAELRTVLFDWWRALGQAGRVSELCDLLITYFHEKLNPKFSRILALKVFSSSTCRAENRPFLTSGADWAGRAV